MAAFAVAVAFLAVIPQRSGEICFTRLAPTLRLSHRLILRIRQLRERLLRLRNLAILQLRSPLQIPLTRSLRSLKPHLFQPLFQRSNLSNRAFLLLPTRAQPSRLLPRLGKLTLHHLQPFARVHIVLTLQRIPLNLQTRSPPLEIIDLHRHAPNLNRQRRSSLIHQINRLIRQEPIRNIPMAQLRRRHNRRVLDPHLVVRLIPLPQPAQNRNRVLDIRLAHIHNLEPPLQRRILLDVLPILIQRGRANRAQLSPRQCRLQHIASVNRAFRSSRTHQRMQFVDEQNNLPIRLVNLLQHRLQPFFKLAAKLRPRQHRSQVQRDHPLIP